MNRSRLAPILGAVLLLSAGCVTRYVVISAVPRSDLQVVVFAEDKDQGNELLEWLSDHGYDNDHNHVALPSDREPGIRYGAAPTAYIDEIAAYIAGRFDIELGREREFKASDYGVFIDLNPSSREIAVAGPPGREELRLVVFTDDTVRGRRLLDSLHALGYANGDNYVTDEPNGDFNVKWGAASDSMAEEIAGVVRSLFSVELDRQHAFKADDWDVFINLPFGAAKKEPTRADFAITIFCDDEKAGQGLLRKLADLGYTNDANEVLSGPNEKFNVKYGGLPEEMLGEIAGLVEKEFKTDVERVEEFGKSSDQVFINIPKKQPGQRD
jgi:hypothetical protein